MLATPDPQKNRIRKQAHRQREGCQPSTSAWTWGPILQAGGDANQIGQAWPRWDREKPLQT